MGRERKRSAIDDRVRIEHMLAASRDIAKYIAGRVRTDLAQNSMLVRALTNAIQEIGEAAANLSDAARARVTLSSKR